MHNSEEQRPDPEQILSGFEQRDAGDGKGKLKVFLGMAAGVGKTYAMLGAARELSGGNTDIAVGFVETHGRRETEALVAGLEVIPRKIIPYRNVTLEEMDIDAVLKRRPEIVMVDEAAHTNAPGSRHAKRWRDILEILNSGIDVWTTLNIQHLESLSDTVREITGLTVKETIPDSIIDIAVEVVLVDLAPEELLKRLKEGKVYGMERAGRAMQNFFRAGNLSALREMSLRLMAERVNRELRDYKQMHHITAAWKTSHRLMVAVYASPYSETLIRWTRRMASGLDAGWFGAYIESDQPLSEDENKLLSRNLALVTELGGEILTTIDDDTVSGLLRLARENQVTQIIVGKSRRGFLHNLRHGGSVVERLLRGSGNIDVYIVSGEPPDSERAGRPGVARPQPASLFMEIGTAIATTAVITLLGKFLIPLIAYRAVGLVFLLGVMVLGLFVGRAAVLLSALLCGLAWNFFFIPPHFTFAISATEDYLMFGAFLITAGVVGHLTTRLRLNEKHLRIREKRITALYHFTGDISSAKDIQGILNAAVKRIGDVLESDTAILVRVPPACLIPHEGNTYIVDDKEMAVAEWVALHKQPAGLFTDTLPTARALYIPLTASQDTVGVMGLKPRRKSPHSPELTALAETFARQLAMGIEREQSNELARQTLLIRESERLYKSILNSVSHELKTPLAAIEGSASALLDPVVGRDVNSSAELAGEIMKASHRLSRLVKNLLDMTRLESGVAPLRREPVDVGDLIGAALRHLEKELAGHPVNLSLSGELPLVNMDFLLMEQAVVNIIHNAAAHTPAGTPVDVSAHVNQATLIMDVSDRGPGLSEEQLERAFDKFWRADPHKPGGTGLGLAIARGWVEAHGGTIQARNREGGGASFIISLPVEATK